VEVYSQKHFEDGEFSEFATHGIKINEFELTIQRRRGGRWGHMFGQGYHFLAGPNFTMELDWPTKDRRLGPNIEYSGDYPRDEHIAAVRAAREFYDINSTAAEMERGPGRWES
jgi:hypothetical protein